MNIHPPINVLAMALNEQHALCVVTYSSKCIVLLCKFQIIVILLVSLEIDCFNCCRWGKTYNLSAKNQRFQTSFNLVYIYFGEKRSMKPMG